MGGGLSFSKSTDNNKAITDQYQSFMASCSNNCNLNQSGNTVNIDGKVEGDVKIINSCTVDTKCMIDSAFSATANSLLNTKSSTDANNAAGLLSFNWDFSQSHDSSTIQQDLRQAVNEGCNANENLYQTNTTINVGIEGDVEGDVELIQQGAGNSDCVLKNLATASAIAQGTITSSTSSGGISWIDILIGIAIFFVVIGLVIALIYAFKGDDKDKMKDQSIYGQNSDSFHQPMMMQPVMQQPMMMQQPVMQQPVQPVQPVASSPLNILNTNGIQQLAQLVRNNPELLKLALV